MLNSQSNTLTGPFPITANIDLSAREGYLVSAIDGGTKAYADLPAAASTVCIGVLSTVDVAGKQVQVTPLTPDREVKIVAKGTGSAGAILVLADPGTAADKGKVRTTPATAGVYFSPGIAQEDFVDGQLVSVRPFPRIHRVVNADTLTALTFSTAAAGTEVAALRAALLTILETQGLVA